MPRACCCLQGWGGQRGAAGSGRTCSLPSSCSSSAVVDSLGVKLFEMPLLSSPTLSPARMENNPWCWGAAASLPRSPRELRKHVLDKQASVCPKGAQVRALLARAGVFSLHRSGVINKQGAEAILPCPAVSSAVRKGSLSGAGT